jgi:hypothetical protein
VFQLALDPEQAFTQIGSDGKLLCEPVLRKDLLRLVNVLRHRGLSRSRGSPLDARQLRKRTLPVWWGACPWAGRRAPCQNGRSRAMAETRDPPAGLASVPQLKEAAAAKTWRLILVEIVDTAGRPVRTLLDGRRFMDPVTEDPKTDSIEIWEFVNTTMDTHPIHLHAVHFQVLDRQSFDARRYRATPEIVLTGKPIEAPPEEQGWKDTVLCPPGLVTRIITPFSGEPGHYVWHCHMLEHEDNEMMNAREL